MSQSDPDADEQPPLRYRTEDLVQQLTRYSGQVCSHELLDVLWALTNVNDDLVHLRDPALVVAGIERAKALLAKVPGELFPGWSKGEEGVKGV